jgi:hypothetical protein
VSIYSKLADFRLLTGCIGEKQARIIEDLKRLAATAQADSSNIRLQPASESSSGRKQPLVPPPSDHGVHLRQSPEKAGKRLLDPDFSTDSMEAGNLDFEFSRSFIPEITSVFSEVSLPWDNDGLSAPQPPLDQGMSVVYQPSPIGITDMTYLAPLSFDENNMYSAETLERTDSVDYWARVLDVSHLSGDLNRRHSNGGSDPNLMPRYSNPDAFHPSLPINLDPKLDYRTSAVYLNEYGTIDQKKDQLEPFRRLFQLDNTPENNQLINLAIERKHDIREIMLAGFRAINSPVNSSKEAMKLLSSPFLADPYKNNLRLVRAATLDAYLSNALSLGMDIPTLYREHCSSPFYRPRTNRGEDIRNLVAKMSINLPEHLKPTPPQVLCPHHPYLDLLPFPTLRARAIALTSRNPPLIDGAELKSDIMSDGLICWRTSGSGRGQPWNMKSWEAAPWFLKKWSILVGGEEEEVWKQTKWWRELRGEERISNL